MDQLISPIGMEPLVELTKQCCFCARQYHVLGIQPGHFVVTLDAGNGRTTAAAYLADAFAAAGVCRFSGQDPVLEYRLDGSSEQLCRTLRSIRASAVYTNRFEGVIALDITALAPHTGEEPVRLFLRELADIARHAVLVFFLPQAPSRSQLALMEKVSAALGPEQMHWVRIPPYSAQTLAAITRRTLTARLNIRLEDGPQAEEALQKLVRQTGITSARQAVQMAGILARRADFSEFIPVLSAQQLTMQQPKRPASKTEV